MGFNRRAMRNVDSVCQCKPEMMKFLMFLKQFGDQGRRMKIAEMGLQFGLWLEHTWGELKFFPFKLQSTYSF